MEVNGKTNFGGASTRVGDKKRLPSPDTKIFHLPFKFSEPLVSVLVQ